MIAGYMILDDAVSFNVTPHQVTPKLTYVFGHTSVAAPLNSGIRRLIAYTGSTEEILLTATDTTVQAWTNDIGGSTGEVEKTGLTSSDWSTAMMGNNLAMVNGVDPEIRFNGSEFLDLVITGPTEKMYGVTVFKSRSYFWERSALGFWYSAVSALGGSLRYFDLTTQLPKGGHVVSINSWTKDGGSGPDDFLCITTNKGSVLVYQGSNPNDIFGWGIVGRYTIPEPINKHCFLELDGRVHVLTKSDYVIMPERFQQFTRPSRISGAISAAWKKKSGYAQWAVHYDSERQWIVLTIPINGSTSRQLIRTTTGWFEALDFFDFGLTVVDDVTYIGTDDTVYKIGGGANENEAGQKEWIRYAGMTAYQALGTNRDKDIVAFRFKLRSAMDIYVNTALSFDNSEGLTQTQSLAMLQTNPTSWGDVFGGTWDTPDTSKQEWFVGEGHGQTVAMKIWGQVNSPWEWLHTDVEFNLRGGFS
jgi:hypothetical protein